MANHLEDFLELSCDELKFYLRQRTIPVSGNHSDLAARALVAFEQNVPVKNSAEDLAKVLQHEYKALLKSLDIQQGQPLVEKIDFDINLWKDIIAKLVIFFKGYVQRVLLGLRPLCFCFVCEKPCLEPEEFDSGNSEESIQCESCQMWLHCLCVARDVNEDSTFICVSFNEIAQDS